MDVQLKGIKKIYDIAGHEEKLEILKGIDLSIVQGDYISYWEIWMWENNSSKNYRFAAYANRRRVLN